MNLPLSGAVRGTLTLILIGISVAITAVSTALSVCVLQGCGSAVRDDRIVHVLGLVFTLPDQSGWSWWRRAPSIERLGSYVKGVVELHTDGRVRDVPVAAVSAEFFDVFDLKPALGRFFQDKDEEGRAMGVAVLGERLFKSYGYDGTSLATMEVRLGERLFTVVGVAPAEFNYPRTTQIWVAGRPGSVAARLIRRRSRSDDVSEPWAGWLARLKNDGATAERAQDELYALLARLNDRHRSAGRNFGDTITVQPLREADSYNLKRTPVLMAIGSLALVAIAVIYSGAFLSTAAKLRRGNIPLGSPMRPEGLCVFWSWAVITIVAVSLSYVLVHVAHRKASGFIPVADDSGATAIVAIAASIGLTTTIACALIALRTRKSIRSYLFASGRASR